MEKNDAISRSDLIKIFEQVREHPDNILRDFVFLDGVLAVVDSAPALDVAPVVHARWEKTCEWMPIYRCSKCKERNLFKNGNNVLSNYCPNCGAKMDA